MAPTQSPTRAPVVSHPSVTPTHATQSPDTAAANTINVPLVAGAAGGAAAAALAALAVLLLVLHHRRVRIAKENGTQAGTVATANPKFQQHDINV